MVQRCIAEHWRGWFIPPWIPESPQASVSHCGILYTFPSFISMSSGYSVISAYTLHCSNFLYTFPFFISMSSVYSEHLACQWVFQCNLTQSLRFALLTTHHSQKRATLRQQKIVIGCPRKRVNIKSKVFGRAMIFYTAKDQCMRNVKLPPMDIWSSARKMGIRQKWCLAVEK